MGVLDYSGYKIGMLEIQRLRGVAEKALGERFDIGAFDQEVLEDGGIPLQVLEAEVQDWIAAQQASWKEGARVNLRSQRQLEPTTHPGPVSLARPLPRYPRAVIPAHAGIQ